MALYGFNFRSTSGFIGSDAYTGNSNATYVTNADTYSQTRIGMTFGRESGLSQPRDRNASLDPRIAGCHFYDGSGGMWTFRWDLTGTGTWGIRAAMGDEFDRSGTGQYVEFQDGTTPFYILDSTFPGGGNVWWDPTSTVYNQTTWPSSNAQITHTFLSTIFRVQLGQNTPTPPGFIAHLELDDAPGGGGPAIPSGALGQRIIRRRLRG